MYGYIYITTNLLNGKIYIGQHKSPIFDKNYFGSGVWFKRILLANGKENFKCEILEKCNTLEEMNCKEIYWIEKYQSTNPSIGYNLAKGGEQVYIGCTDKERKIISESLLHATEKTIYDEIDKLRKYGLKIYQPYETWEPTSTNSVGEKMKAKDLSIVISFYIKKQLSITKHYAKEFNCQFWKYNLMVEINKIPNILKTIKKDYEENILIPETFKGPGIGTTGVFLETNRGSRSARMYI